MVVTRRQDLPVESSWRMVEGGENDSFDTTIVRDAYETEGTLSSYPSQLSGSQPFSVGGSQDDNIESFLSKAEVDDRVLLRSPFRPSIPQSVRRASREEMKRSSPEPEFYMPAVDIDASRRSDRSSTTIRAVDLASAGSRRRPAASAREGLSKSDRPAAQPPGGVRRPLRKSPSESLPGSRSLLGALLRVLGWAAGVVALAFSYARKPLALFLAIYLVLAALLAVQDTLTRSIQSSLSPLCRLPGVSWLALPFCPAVLLGDAPPPAGGTRVEFDGLMKVQGQFEEVFEQSARGVSLPMEMKRSEASVRDLRTLVRYSTLQSKEELVLEFDGYIEATGTASNDLLVFNTHVSSAIDSVISINRWTSRYISGLAAEHEGRGWLGEWAGWLFSPLQPAVFSERILLDQYVQHTSLVSDKIAGLIVEAQAVLRTLVRAEDHLGVIYDLVTRTQRSVQSRKDEVLWTLWTLIGANTRHLHNLDSQLSLLCRVDGQRAGAVRQVTELIVELERIQAGLGDLRDRVAEPEIARSSWAEVPLSVHIETINKGVERLELARIRIREMENERIREVLTRGKEERLIESV